MKTRRFAVSMAVLMALIGLSFEAEASSRIRRSSSTARISSSAKAIAALTPVGAATGWGRVKVEEKMGGLVSEREVEVDLFGLEPETEHAIEVNGVVLGTVMTDGSGWASLKLESPDDEHPPVPDTLPAIGDLELALVRDDTDAFVLEGSFLPLAATPMGDGAKYQEKIQLIDQMGGAAQGVAKVEREGDEQEFETWATGLVAYQQYTIEVDDIAAGMVFASMAGQAKLELEAPDDTNPLPPSLQPVENLRNVEWLNEAGELVLFGTFTGVPSDDDADEDADHDDGEDEFKGGITELLGGGFMLQTATMLLTVYVDEVTTYEDVAGFEDLMVGDIVEVHGDMLSETEVQALRVELEDGDDDGDDDDGDDDD